MKSAEILKELIKIPSLNPEDTQKAAWIGEKRVVDWVEAYLTPLGFTFERLQLDENRPTLLARLAGGQAQKTLCLEVHADTVAVDTMVIPPFTPEERDGRIYGRGACDDKGPMAAVLAALDAELVEQVLQSAWELVVVISAGEEKSCLGAIQLAASGFTADRCLVLEPTEFTPVIAHKGPLWVEVEVQGRAVHGSTPELGVNAIEGMSEFLRQLRQLERENAQRHEDPYLGIPTVNFGTIKGGMAANIVPDSCTVQIDRRCLPSEDVEGILASWKRLLEDLTLQGLITGYTLSPGAAGRSFLTDPASEMLHTLNKSVAKHTEVKPPTGSGWFSDAGPLSEVCEEIVVFGPGSIKQAHTKDEWGALEQLELGEKILRDFILSTINQEN